MSDLISDWHNWKWVRCSGPAEFGPEGCPACEIKRLTAELSKATKLNEWFEKRCQWYQGELAEKDKRIGELEESLRIDEATIAAWNTRFRCGAYLPLKEVSDE